MSLQKMFTAIGVVAVLVILGGAGWKAFLPATISAQQGGGTGVVRSICELPITQHFGTPVGEIGRIDGTGTYAPFSAAMPSTAGFAISQLISEDCTECGGSSFTSSPTIEITVNGLLVYRGVLFAPNLSGNGGGPVDLNPPVVVGPGATIVIGTPASGPIDGRNKLFITGYMLTADDFGL